MTAQEVRTLFLTYFQQHGHVVVPSASLVPIGDPSVLLTTAGMQQFKAYFKEPALADAKLASRRAVSVQKSFRTTDINEVGDTSHLTFFEMLGNFSFGDYFKDKAIEWAWLFMRDALNIAPERMHVTIFRGEGEVPRDEASAKIWRKLGVSENRIKEGTKADNFWGPTGDDGPCGPTTEIYVDGLEVWNLVFNEYYCHSGGRLERLTQPGVDTGMGLERLLKVLAKVPTIYETDVFAPIIKVVAGREAKAGPVDSDQERARRIIADHLKAGCFLIADGVRPSNVKQGYILRRLIRRAARYERLLGLADDFLPAAVGSVIDLYQAAYPELGASKAAILKVIGEERTVFQKALSRGLKVFEQMLRDQSGSLTGSQAFRLYESFGFPFELTAELARERSLSVSRAEFEAAAREHQAKSRAALS